MTTKSMTKEQEQLLIAKYLQAEQADDETVSLQTRWEIVLSCHGTIIKAVTAICKGIDLDEREQMVTDIEIILIDQFSRYNPDKCRYNTWASMRARCLTLDLLRKNKHQYHTNLTDETSVEDLNV